MDRLDETLLLDAPQRRTARRLTVGFAADGEERRAAQRLRWRVFAEELGAQLDSAEPGIDQDIFDAYCEHLVVKDGAEVVGTYRILPPEAAKRIGLYYDAETEFDLIRLRGIRGRMVELGRSRIAPEYRSGGVIALLWAGVARYVLAHGYAYLAGCASMSVAHAAAAAPQFEKHLAPPEYRVTPRRRLPPDVRALCDALNIRRVRLAGVSAGAPYALACAALLRERVVKTAIVSGSARRARCPPRSSG